MGGYYDDEDDGILQDDYAEESYPESDSPEPIENNSKSTDGKYDDSDNNNMNTELCYYVNDCIESLGLKPCAFEWCGLSPETRLAFLAELARIRDEHKDDMDIYSKTRDIAFYLDTRYLFKAVRKRCQKFFAGQNKTSVNDAFDQLYEFANEQWAKYDPSRKTLFSNFVLNHIKKINPDELRTPIKYKPGAESTYRSFASKRNEYLKKHNLDSIDDTQLRLLLGATEDKIIDFHEWEARSNPKSFEADESNKQLESTFETPTDALARKELLEKFRKATDALGLTEAECKARDMLFDCRPKESKNRKNDKVIKPQQKLDDNFVALVSAETGLGEDDIRKLWARLKECLRSDKEFCEYVNQRPKRATERLRTNTNNTIANGMRNYLGDSHDDEDDEVFEDYSQTKIPSPSNSQNIHFYDEYVLNLSSKGVSKLPKSVKNDQPENEQALSTHTEELFEDELYSEEAPAVAVKLDKNEVVPVKETTVQKVATSKKSRKKSVTIESAPDIEALINPAATEPAVPDEQPVDTADVPDNTPDIAPEASPETITETEPVVISEEDAAALREEERKRRIREIKKSAHDRRKARESAENEGGLPKEIASASKEEAEAVRKRIAAEREAAAAVPSTPSKKKAKAASASKKPSPKTDESTEPAAASSVVVTVTDTVPPLPDQNINNDQTAITAEDKTKEMTPVAVVPVTAVPAELEPDYDTTLAFFNGVCRKIDNADKSIAEIESETAALEERDAAINKVIEGAQALGDLDNEYIRMKIEEKTGINTRLRKNIMEAEQVRKGLPLLGEIRDKLKEYLDTFSK